MREKKTCLNTHLSRYILGHWLLKCCNETFSLAVADEQEPHFLAKEKIWKHITETKGRM